MDGHQERKKANGILLECLGGVNCDLFYVVSMSSNNSSWSEFDVFLLHGLSSHGEKSREHVSVFWNVCSQWNLINVLSIRISRFHSVMVVIVGSLRVIFFGSNVSVYLTNTLSCVATYSCLKIWTTSNRLIKREWNFCWSERECLPGAKLKAFWIHSIAVICIFRFWLWQLLHIVWFYD